MAVTNSVYRWELRGYAIVPVTVITMSMSLSVGIVVVTNWRLWVEVKGWELPDLETFNNNNNNN
ncbi:hypothetical protein HK102_011901, partial [Quaeritorhiza haematococci]